jgi:hypothetical protein
MVRIDEIKLSENKREEINGIMTRVKSKIVCLFCSLDKMIDLFANKINTTIRRNQKYHSNVVNPINDLTSKNEK